MEVYLMNDWFQNNKNCVWLPYVAHSTPNNVTIPIEKASGCTLFTPDGIKILDGISGWWTMCHGYAHPYINQRMKEQIDKTSHLSMANCAAEATYTLAGRLINLIAGDAAKVLFTESGSSATDAALKMALQYHQIMGTNKSRFIYFENGYHGETLASFDVSDVNWTKTKNNNFCLKIPKNNDDLIALEKKIATIAHDVAAIIIEPLMQGAGGMRFYSAEILRGIFSIAQKHSLLFIVDEIAVGFYRLGDKMFAFQKAEIQPDIVLLGKALSGGHCGGCGAIVANNRVASAFDHIGFDHGTTFMGNPLFCAAANASLDLFENFDVIPKINKLEKLMLAGLFELKKLVRDVRVQGAVGVVEFNDDIDTAFLRAKFIERGIWLRPFANVLYIIPAFIMTEAELDFIIENVCDIVRHHTQSLALTCNQNV